MKVLVDKIIENFIYEGIVPNEDREIYSYGLYQGGIMIINILTYIIISVYFKMVWENLVFLLTYIPLRSYAGGYHARTQIRCYFLSVLMVILVLLAIKNITWTSTIIMGLIILGGSSIFFLAPVEDSNKPLSDSQLVVFKKVARIILSIELFISLILLWLGYIRLVLPIALAVVTVGIMVVLGWIRNKLIY